MAQNNQNAEAGLFAMLSKKSAKKSKHVTQEQAQQQFYSKVSEGDYAFVKGLLGRTNLQIDINYMNPIGGNIEETALMAAVRRNNLKLVNKILEYGANPNLGMNHGTTPLMVAAKFGNTEILKALVDHGADLQAKDAEGNTALQWALSTKKGKYVLGDLYTFGLRAPDLVPTKRIAQPKPEEEVFDTLMASESTFEETYGDEENIIFKYKTQYFSIPRESLQSQLDDRESIRYECLITTEGSPMENQVKMDEPFYILASAMRFTVPLSQMNYIAHVPDIRLVEILDTARVLPTVAGWKTIQRNNGMGINGEPINIISREHCNPGSEKQVFTLVALEIGKPEGGRRKTYRRKRGYRKRSMRRRR